MVTPVVTAASCSRSPFTTCNRQECSDIQRPVLSVSASHAATCPHYCTHVLCPPGLQTGIQDLQSVLYILYTAGAGPFTDLVRLGSILQLFVAAAALGVAGLLAYGGTSRAAAAALDDGGDAKVPATTVHASAA
jgi:hypothetical protein